MRRARLPDVVGTLLRLGLAAVWLTSGTLKAIDPGQTAVAVRAYEVMPRAGAELVAAVLPFLEIGLGLLLLIGVGTRLVAMVSAALLVVFVAGLVQAWARGLSIDCGCFGGGGVVAPDATAYLPEVLRDVGFLALAGWLLVRPRTLLSMDALLARGKDETWAERTATSADAVRRPHRVGSPPPGSRFRGSGPVPR